MTYATQIRGLSRRQFIKQAGAFGIMVGLPATPNRAPEVVRGTAALFGTSLGLPEGYEIVGRALGQTPIHHTPEESAKVVDYLATDGTYAIQGVAGNGWWYQIADGFVPRTALQPILPYWPPALSKTNGWHEVISPFASIRASCSSLSTIQGRVAFGALLYVHDRLVDDHGQTWYAVSGAAHGGHLFGWVQASHIGPLKLPEIRVKAPVLWLSTTHHKLSIYDEDKLLGEMAIWGAPVFYGNWRVNVVDLAQEMPIPPYVYPYVMSINTPQKPTRVSGAFWHNMFGTQNNAFGQVQLPLFGARWLYAMVASNGPVDVIIE
jgi:hypothetical protein